MTLNNEQLTAQMNELIEANQSLRQESVRRAQEHQALHAQLEEIRTSVKRGGGGPRMNNEMHKRLDRWATSTPERTFAGGDSTVGAGLREWAEAMKERAGYCSEALQEAMQKAERNSANLHKIIY